MAWKVRQAARTWSRPTEGTLCIANRVLRDAGSQVSAAAMKVYLNMNGTRRIPDSTVIVTTFFSLIGTVSYVSHLDQTELTPCRGPQIHARLTAVSLGIYVKRNGVSFTRAMAS